MPQLAELQEKLKNFKNFSVDTEGHFVDYTTDPPTVSQRKLNDRELAYVLTLQNAIQIIVEYKDRLKESSDNYQQLKEHCAQLVDELYKVKPVLVAYDMNKKALVTQAQVITCLIELTNAMLKIIQGDTADVLGHLDSVLQSYNDVTPVVVK